MPHAHECVHQVLSSRESRHHKAQRRTSRPADAVVRGHRSGLLTAADYNNLAQCESLDDIKLNLVRTGLAAVRPAEAILSRHSLVTVTVLSMLRSMWLMVKRWFGLLDCTPSK